MQTSSLGDVLELGHFRERSAVTQYGVALGPIQLFHSEQQGPEVTVTEQGALYAPGAMDGKLFEERRRINRRSSGVIGPRDRHIDTFMQPAPGSRDTIRGRYSWREQRYRALDKWLIDRCRDAWLGQNGVQLRAAE